MRSRYFFLKEKVSKKNFSTLPGPVVIQAEAAATWNRVAGERSVLLKEAFKKNLDTLCGPVIDQAGAAAKKVLIPDFWRFSCNWRTG